MRLNENTAIVGEHVVLVPYRREHVERYHEWMKSPELLEATASEPLSLQEEYEMQEKWHVDDDKLTFIVLSKSTDASVSSITAEIIHSLQMIGDTNLFLPDGSEEDVECEIMIAEPEFRGKGLSKEILSLLLNYAQSHLNIPPRNFISRIGLSNEASIGLFAKLGFGKEKVVEVFQEVTMRFGWVEGSEDGKLDETERLEQMRREKWGMFGQEIAC